MNKIRLLLSSMFLLIPSICAFATLILIYFDEDSIVIAADGKKSYVDDNEKVTDSTLRFCKFQFVDSYCILFAGYPDGEIISRKGDFINYNAYKTIDFCLRNYQYDTAVSVFKNKFKYIIGELGFSIVSRDKNVSKRNFVSAKEPLLIVSIISNTNGTLKSQNIEFHYCQENKIPIVDIKESILNQAYYRGKYLEIGHQLGSSIKTYLESNIKKSIVPTINEVMRMQSDSFSILVGGKVNILNISKDSCSWLQKTTCNNGCSTNSTKLNFKKNK